MPLNIFDAEDAPRPRERNRFAEDVVARIKGGYMIGRRPVASETWVLTTDDPEVADALCGRFGGEVEALEVESGDDHRIVSTTATLDVLLASSADFRTRMVLFGRSGPIHVCDGQTYLEGDDRGQPCDCPQSYQARKDLARAEKGPSPEITFKVRLADDPDFGYLIYRTGSWSLAGELPAIEREIADAFERSQGEPIRLSLRLEVVEYDTKAGRHVRYVRPVVSVRD